MKLCLTFILFLAMILCCCRQTKKSPSSISFDTTKTFTLDSTLQDSIERQIQFVSDRDFSQFKTPIEFRFFSNDLLSDSIIQPDFRMMSWYSNNKDTIDLVAHVGEFETSALLLRFIDRKPNVFFFRAPHERQNYFRINKKDSFENQIEVPPMRYKLELSQIPDTVNKQVVFGYINMESIDYYDKRDTLQQKNRIQMKFYFRSQFRKFDY